MMMMTTTTAATVPTIMPTEEAPPSSLSDVKVSKEKNVRTTTKFKKIILLPDLRNCNNRFITSLPSHYRHGQYGEILPYQEL